MSDGRGATARLLQSLIQADDIDQAERVLYEAGDGPEFSAFRVIVLIQRGWLRDALQLASTLDDAYGMALRALCLRLLGDPAWQATAEEALKSPDDEVRRAVLQLLGQAVA